MSSKSRCIQSNMKLRGLYRVLLPIYMEFARAGLGSLDIQSHCPASKFQLALTSWKVRGGTTISKICALITKVTGAYCIGVCILAENTGTIHDLLLHSKWDGGDVEHG